MKFAWCSRSALLFLVLGCAPASPPPSSIAQTPPPRPSGAPAVTPAAGAEPAPVAPALGSPVDAAVDASDRSPEDRALDAGRKPKELLSFCGIAPGAHVAELGAGGGYTAELLARIVGPQGKVYGQNNKLFLERFAEKPWSERLKKPVNASVVRLDREFDEPLPREVAGKLDAVLLLLLYHDTVWLKTDRVKMNANILASLKPGGTFCVVDHSAREGAGISAVETLHRIEEKVVVDEVSKAGFTLVAESQILKNPSDPRDWSASPRTAAEKRGTSDRFVLRFQKPGS
jgi:predicted methyltransferase